MTFLDVVSVALPTLWFYFFVVVLPKMEERNPGFYEFLIKTTGRWFVWMCVIMSMFLLSNLVYTVAGWINLDRAASFAASVTVQSAFFAKVIGARIDRFKIF